MRHLLFALASLGILAGSAARADDSGAYGTIPVDTKDEKKSDDRRERNESVTYSGIGLARVSTDFENLKDAVNLNFSIGFRVPTIDWIGAELELSTTVIPGENETTSQQGGSNCGGVLQPPCPSGDTQSGNDLQTNSAAVYAVLRSPGKFYGMAKYGYRYLNTSIDELQDNRSGSAWGVGAGYRWGSTLSGVELYYTRLTPDVTFMGFALAYGFGGHRD